jgi:hypothetical protein
MRFKIDYISIIFITAVVSILSFSIIDRLTDPTNDMYTSLLLGFLLLISVIGYYLLNSFCEVVITKEELILKYIFKGTKEMRQDRIKGLVYKFHYDSRTKHSWKEIQITFIDGSPIRLRKWYFANFEGLEGELRKRFKVLVPSTGSIATDIQVRELEREINYFDIKTSKKEILMGLSIGTIVTLLSIVLFMDKNVGYGKSISIGLIGMYFLYTTAKNICYFKTLRANRHEL